MLYVDDNHYDLMTLWWEHQNLVLYVLYRIRVCGYRWIEAVYDEWTARKMHTQWRLTYSLLPTPFKPMSRAKHNTVPRAQTKFVHVFLLLLYWITHLCVYVSINKYFFVEKQRVNVVICYSFRVLKCSKTKNWVFQNFF